MLDGVRFRSYLDPTSSQHLFCFPNMLIWHHPNINFPFQTCWIILDGVWICSNFDPTSPNISLCSNVLDRIGWNLISSSHNLTLFQLVGPGWMELNFVQTLIQHPPNSCFVYLTCWIAMESFHRPTKHLQQPIMQTNKSLSQFFIPWILAKKLA